MNSEAIEAQCCHFTVCSQVPVLAYLKWRVSKESFVAQEQNCTFFFPIQKQNIIFNWNLPVNARFSGWSQKLTACKVKMDHTTTKWKQKLVKRDARQSWGGMSVHLQATNTENTQKTYKHWLSVLVVWVGSLQILCELYDHKVHKISMHIFVSMIRYPEITFIEVLYIFSRICCVSKDDKILRVLQMVPIQRSNW